MSKFIYQDNDGSLTIGPRSIVELRLASEKRLRVIGSLARNGSRLVSYYKTDKEDERFKKTDAWSINWNVLSFLPDPGSTVNIKTEKAIYRITKEKAVALGSFLHFKDAGIEKKIYVPVDQFNVELL